MLDNFVFQLSMHVFSSALHFCVVELGFIDRVQSVQYSLTGNVPLYLYFSQL